MAAPARKIQARAGFLPRGTIEFLRRALVQAGGLLVLAAGAALAVALASANPHDPSFNTAANGPVFNLLGRPGALVADFLFQAVGWGAAPLLVLALVWGGGLVLRARPPGEWPLRLALLPPAMVAVAVALAALPLPETASLPAGAGGALGHLIADGLIGLAPEIGLWLVAPPALLVAAAACYVVVGLKRADWVALAGGPVRLARGGRAAAAAVAGFARRLGTRRSGRGEPVLATTEPRVRTVRPSPTVSTVSRPAPADVPPPFPYDAGEEEEEEEAAPYVPPPQGVPVQSKPVAAVRVGPAVPPPAPLPRPQTDSGFELPPLDLLERAPDQGGLRLGQEALTQNARQLETVLEDFGVNGKVVKVRPGPVVTLYELEPAPGTKTSRVIGLADDIARSMSALSVRIATIPGRSVIGIELPNQRREMVFLRDLMESEAFDKAPARLTLVLGKDIGGSPVMVDLARMPHLLIAGTTGSGKSVAINTMILSLLYRLSPEECRIIMIDPKMLELSVYDGIPHLLAPVVTEPGKAVVALKWAVREMEDRYRAMSQLGVRNIAGYNARLREAAERGEVLTRTVQVGFDPETGKPLYEDQTLALEALPFIVVIVDEMADLMLVAGKDIEAAVQRLAQMARAAGIHILMATQRPSVDVITGTIKANFPTRISFQVTSKIDSRTILGEQGAEQLLGQGDMLYMAAGGRITRVHGPFVSDREVERVVEHLRAQGEPSYVEAVTEEEGGEFGAPGTDGGGSGDDLYDQAVALVIREGKASTSFVQRHLQIGYNRAARLIERMEAEGVVGKPNHVGKREVLARGGGEY